MARPNDIKMSVSFRNNLWMLYAEEPGDFTTFLEVRHDFSKDPDEFTLKIVTEDGTELRPVTATEFAALAKMVEENEPERHLEGIKEELLDKYIILDANARCFRQRAQMIEKWKALNMIASFAISGS